MKKQSRILLLIAAIALLVLAAFFFLNVFVQVDGDIYFLGVASLDLRGKEITTDTYDTLVQKIPNCDIVWDVPFQGRTVSSDETDLTITGLSDEDVLTLDYLPLLQTVHAEQCENFNQLAELQRRHPQCSVLYSIPIAGESYAPSTRELSISSLTEQDAQLLTCFPELRKVEVSGSDDYTLLLQLQQEHPEWNLTYTVTLGDQDYSWDATSVRASDVSFQDISLALTGMPYLTKMHITNPDAEAAKLLGLREQYPDVTLSWDVQIYDKTATEDTTELDISGILVESCEEVERLVACLPNLEKLIMSDCGIDSETMAEFRERQRENYKVIWTVYLGDKCKARTDDLYFMPIKQGEYYFLDSMSYELRYCEDMICLDLGHHMIHNVDFLAYMPHLKYLILAHSGVRDISPIVACQELVYLEVDWSEIQDYTPIAELKSLEDLNLNQTACDITPILQMTWLKNLWAPGKSYATQQKLLEALPDTNVVLTNSVPKGQGWRNLPNYYAMRDVLGMYYMD